MKPFNEMTEEDKFNSDGFEVCPCGMKLPHRSILLHYSDGNQTICPNCAVKKLDEYVRFSSYLSDF